jgi:hypothetical protein
MEIVSAASPWIVGETTISEQAIRAGSSLRPLI